MGLMDNKLPLLLENSEAATSTIREADPVVAAEDPEEANKWVQISTDLRYILINICSGAAATVCRQYQTSIGFEIYRQLCIRFSIPLGTRPIGYLTKLLKPTFDMNNFEETFSQWEFELNKFERDNGHALPESVKIAVLLNETNGPLQQHLQLLAGQSPTYNQVRTTIMEYYRSITAFNKLKQQTSSNVSTNPGGGSAPMDISAIKGKGKGYKGKGKDKGKGKGKGKSYGGYKSKGKGNKGYGQGKGALGQVGPFGMKGQSQQQQANKGKGKGAKGKQAQDVCYRCGQPGHIAKHCRVPVYNLGDNQQTTTDQYDNTQQWYEDPHVYEGHWWNNARSTTTCITSTTYNNNIRQCTHSPDCTWSTLSWTNYDCTHSWQQFVTAISIHWHYGRQWSSNTCLPTMVCTRISSATVSSKQWTTIANSDQQWDQTLWLQGLHAQCRRTTNCHTILCMWRTSTNCISFKVGRTRFYPYIWWRTKTDYTSKRIQRNTHQTTKPILSQSNNHSNPSKLPTTSTTDTWRNSSNDCTDNIDSTRSRTNTWRKQWFLDV